MEREKIQELIYLHQIELSQNERKDYNTRPLKISTQ